MLTHVRVVVDYADIVLAESLTTLTPCHLSRCEYLSIIEVTFENQRLMWFIRERKIRVKNLVALSHLKILKKFLDYSFSNI